jgi:hypothetical protein
MAARFVGTSRLSNIIHMITISSQSGILRATRNQNGLREMGQIRFINGEPVSALLGSLTGGSALNALNVWGECMYAFDETESDADMLGYDPTTQTPTLPPNPSSPIGPASPWPSYGYPSTSSLNSFSPLPPDTTSSNLNDPFGSYITDPTAPISSLYGHGYRQTETQWPSPSPYSSGATVTALPLRPEQLASRPRRTTPSMNVDQLPLDRRERMVLLLIDGQRSVMDLVRLTRRQESDLYAVLNHLRVLGLVTL